MEVWGAAAPHTSIFSAFLNHEDGSRAVARVVIEIIIIAIIPTQAKRSGGSGRRGAPTAAPVERTTDGQGTVRTAVLPTPDLELGGEVRCEAR
ncbi:MAG: hypothetical protein MAG451_03203 [Anaerolineales bacterium]|nr:hypothetical protein [Anaerolineales bacterium]